LNFLKIKFVVDAFLAGASVTPLKLIRLEEEGDHRVFVPRSIKG